MNEQNQNIYERGYTSWECGFAWICVLVGYIVARAFPTDANPIGMLLASLLAIGSALFVFIKNGKKLGVAPICAAGVSVALSLVPVFSTTDFSVGISFFASVIAYCYFVYSANGNCLEKGFSNFIIFDFINALFVYPFNNFGKLFPAMFSGKKNGWKLAMKISLGALAGIIPTAIVISELEYDENFASIMSGTLGIFKDFSIFSHICSLAVGGFLGIFIFSIYFSSTEGVDGGASLGGTRAAIKTVQAIPVITILAALIPLVLVYIVFFVSQWDYYTSAFKGVLPDSLIYATYAREGFFQLCRVSAINLAIVSAVSIFASRKAKGSDLFLKLVRIVFSLITLVLIATAMSKMWLYIDSYGLTVKRVLSSWFMVLLALVFVVIILKQFIPKIKTVVTSLVIALVMFLLLAFSNYPSIIANYNVDRYILCRYIGFRYIYYIGNRYNNQLLFYIFF